MSPVRRPTQQGELVEIESLVGEPDTQLVHQFNRQVVALNPDVDVQAEDQDGAGDILQFLFQLGIPLMRSPLFVLPQGGGMSAGADKRQPFLYHQPGQLGPQGPHLVTRGWDIWQDMRDQLDR